MADGKVMFDAALALLVDREGGSFTWTQSEYHAMRARRGPWQLHAEVDKTGPGEPTITIRMVPSTSVDEATPVS